MPPTSSHPLHMIPAGRARLATVDEGRGDALVFIHAGVADHRMWRPQLDTFSATHRVVAFDQRGFGRSEGAPEPFSRVADLIAVMDALSVQSAVLVGGSIGGRAAIDAALAHPARVRGLVLVAPAVTGAPAPGPFSGLIQERVARIEEAEAREDIDVLNALEAQVWLDGPAEPAGRVQGALRDLFLDMNGTALRAPSPGEMVGEPDAWQRLPELAMPVLLVWGTQDFPFLVARMHDMAGMIPRARAAVIEGTAHLPSLERPDVFNAALRAFLAEI